MSRKVAVITGASRGIGKGIALGLADQGATVYVTGRTVTPGSYPLPGTVGETAAECDRRGAANGALFALGPVFAVGIGMAATNAPLFTSSIVLGSALGVLPIAAISDRVDRRLVIAAVMIAGAACEVGLSRLTAPGAWLLVLGFLVGLTTYSLYTLAVSLANDHGDPHDLIFISVDLLFI